jgi:iron only hydrogenase large subunit-like protein
MKKEVLKFPLKGEWLAMLAPSFIVDFSYPKIISQLRSLGFDKVVELSFGAKMVNREYHKKLKNSKGLVIASVCPGIVETIGKSFPKYKKNLIQVNSPMMAMAKICKKTYPKHKIVFISPCNFKKIEAQKSKNIDAVLDYNELKCILAKNKFRSKKSKGKVLFDKFYNDYTKIYPVAGGLSKTAHLKKILKDDEMRTIGGIKDVLKFLENPDKNVKFLDVNFCKGSCIGGPCVSSRLPLKMRRRKVLNYLKKAKREDIPETKKGLVGKAKEISFVSKN